MALQDAKIRLLQLQRFVTGGSNKPEPPRSWKIVSALVIPLLAAMLCGVVLWTYVPPVVDYPIFVLAAFGLIVLGATWLVTTLWGAIYFRSYLRSSIAPMIVLATMMLTSANVPFKLGFFLSKGALTRASAACLQESSGSVGVFDVRWVRALEGGCLFFTSGGLNDSVGIAYMPEGVPNLGPPRRDGDIGYWRIEGDWYGFVERF